MKNTQAKSLPVITYHYVSDYKNAIAVSREQFEDHCRTLAKHGWRGVSLAEAEAFLTQGEPLPEKSMLFTFDDGYLDNYLHALPLLHKYGHMGVMFAVSNRLEADDTLRVPLHDVLAGTAAELPDVHLPVRENELGYRVRRDIFCNHAEVRAMDQSGVMAVAAHSRGHYGVYLGPEYQGFVRPGKQLRTFYLSEHEFVWGMPAFKLKSGLVHRAFVPNPELVEAVKDLVPQETKAADAFFADEENSARLTSLVEGFSGRLGCYETDAERRERMWREIAGGKADLEAILGKPLKTLCWPWGEYSPEALALGREAGFSLFFTTNEGANPPLRPSAVHRFKGKAKGGDWLLSRLRLYAHPWLGALYARIRL